MTQVFRIRQASVVPTYSAPPIEAYEAWLTERAANRTAGRVHVVSPLALRRFVMLHRAGDSISEAARCAGMKTGTAHKLFKLLPEELR